MSVQQRARLRQLGDIEVHRLNGATIRWLVDQALGAEHVMAYHLTVDPASTTSHVHPGAEEVLYVLEGSGEIRVEGAAHQMGPGRAVFVPEGAEHSYVSGGQAPLVVVGAMAPPIQLDAIRPVIPRLDLTGLWPAGVDERGVAMDEGRVAPTLMGERSFRVLVSPAVGCGQMTQFTGVIPTGRAPLHAHPHEEAVYILAGSGRLWIEEEPVGELRPGSAVFFPIGVRHTLENTGTDDLRVLGAFSPSGSPAAKLSPQP